MKFEDKDLRTTTLIKSNCKKPCFICKQPTQYIDYCSELRLCSYECEQQFYNIVSEQESKFKNNDDIF